MHEPLKLLNTSAGCDSCCIFRVPRSPSEINEKAYQPHIVSIGPFHHREPHFQMIQQHKWRFLGDLLFRGERKSVVLKDFFEVVAPMEEDIRKSYSETLEFHGRDLIQMMVLDGCFIIELFCKVKSLGDASKDPSLVEAVRKDPLFTMAWVLPFLMRDLLQLENQIPYTVLQELFDMSVGSGKDGSSLTKLALRFFNYGVQRLEHVLEKYYDKKPTHLLDLFRMSYIPVNCQDKARGPSKFLHLIQCATKLHQAGVRFKPRKTHNILDVKFKNGILEIPVLIIDDFWSSLFLNVVAYEQCYAHPPKDITRTIFTTYATLMGCLINTPADAGFLGDHKIIKNYFGTDEEVARFLNNVRKEVAFDIRRSYLSKVFEEVNEYYENDWHVYWAGFKHRYFNTPWSFISAAAAGVLLLLTTIQAFYSAYPYLPRDKNH
ncbi:hypothetical protein BT93_B1846 [Corymbia citriodora subsp. variegata]|nr:hypothetical protein BT93_B1846 [Corymbia citriodora subsp. variegata]